MVTTTAFVIVTALVAVFVTVFAALLAANVALVTVLRARMPQRPRHFPPDE